MKIHQMWVGIILLAMLCLPVGCTQTQENEESYSASRFDGVVTVEEGGSLLVTETIGFDFVGGPFTFVFRELPLGKTDGISVLEASVDGVVYPVGENPGQVEISSGDPMRIEWHLEPSSNSSHTVQLTYRVDGVVRQEEGADALYWQPLPDSYDYFVGESETVITYPVTTALVSEPTIEAGTAVIQQSPNQVTFTAQNLQPNTPLVVSLRFEEGSLISAPPNWQAQQQANAERLPYWLGLAVLVLGAGLAGMVVTWRRHSASINGKGTVMSPPSDLPPAVAGALLSQGKPNWNHAQGTMFSLAEQGVLIIEELPEKKWYRKHDFAVKQIDQVSGLRRHEAGFLGMLFVDKNGHSTSIKLSDMGKKITGSGWKKYKKPLEAEIEAAGFLSESRQRARSMFLGMGVLLLALGVIGILPTAIWGGSLGFGPWAVIIAVMLLGVASILFGSALVPLSDVGAETAVSWKAFNNYLKAVSKGNRAVDSPTMFEKYLPYAAAFGLLHQWAKHFEKEGWTETPEYFHVLPTTTGNQAMVAFVAMSAATHSSGGSASGSAGAGAAGGGASGAG